MTQEEINRRISLAQMGHSVSLETREKIRRKLLGRFINPATSFKKGHISWIKGKHFSKEARKNMSISKKLNYQNGTTKKYWLGKKRPEISGENNNHWKGGISLQPGYEAFLERHRNYLKKSNGGKHTFQEWLALKEKYNFTCPCCLKKEPEITLTEDHIKPLSLQGSNNIDNIQPLCMLCNTKKKIQEIRYLIPVSYTNKGYLIKLAENK